MRTTYFNVPGVVEFYAEYPSVLRGRAFFDRLSLGGDLLLYAGALHIVIGLPATRKVRRWAAITLLAALPAIIVNMGSITEWIAALSVP